MPRTFRLAVLLGLFVLAGLAFPSAADAQRRGGGGGAGGAHGAATVRAGGAVVHGGGGYGGSRVAVPRTHAPYSYYRPYYAHRYNYRPYYYPHYYSPFAFSLSFGFGYGYYAPFYGYPYPAYAYPYPYPYPPPYQYPSQGLSQPQSPSPPLNDEYNNTLSTAPHSNSPAEGRTTTAGGDDRGEFGTLSIRVMPSDAVILIDQQAWDRPRGDDRFSIELAEGAHHVEIRRSGYTTYVRTIDVPRGRSVVLNVALTSAGTGTMQVTRTVPLRH